MEADIRKSACTDIFLASGANERRFAQPFYHFLLRQVEKLLFELGMADRSAVSEPAAALSGLLR